MEKFGETQGNRLFNMPVGGTVAQSRHHTMPLRCRAAMTDRLRIGPAAFDVATVRARRILERQIAAESAAAALV
jgi:hypothetical protein